MGHSVCMASTSGLTECQEVERLRTQCLLLLREPGEAQEPPSLERGEESQAQGHGGIDQLHGPTEDLCVGGRTEAVPSGLCPDQKGGRQG